MVQVLVDHRGGGCFDGIEVDDHVCFGAGFVESGRSNRHGELVGVAVAVGTLAVVVHQPMGRFE